MLFSHTLQHASRYLGSRVALSGEVGSVTFTDLDLRVKAVAAELHERGVRAGDRLALHLLNCNEYIELVFACCRLGVIVVPINIRYTAAEVDAVLDDCKPVGIIRHRSLCAPTLTAPWQVVLDDQPLTGSTGECPDVFYDEDAVFGLFYTSGTTGRGKGVMLTHKSLFANLQNGLPYLGIREGGCYLHAAPIFHLADFPGILTSAAMGCSQAFIPRFNLQDFCVAVQRHRVTSTVLIPTMINFLTLYQDLESYDLSSLDVVLYGGSPIAPEVLKRARKIFPKVKFVQGYGMTESSCLLTVLRDEDHTEERLVSCGRPPFGVDLGIADANGNLLPAGEVGEIVARGQNLMQGYWNQPLETARTMAGGWLHTGDVGKQDEEGFFYVLDRAKDMIVTGGENVCSTEVESVLFKHPAVKEAAVIGIPDEKWGEIVVACVVLKEGAATAPEELIAHCRPILATYKLPRRVEIYKDELPKSGTGKVLKRELREPYWKGLSRGVS